MREWLKLHHTYPLPTNSLDELVVQTGLTLTQMNQWFTNARRPGRRVLAEVRAKVEAEESSLAEMTALVPPPDQPLDSGLAYLAYIADRLWRHQVGHVVLINLPDFFSEKCIMT